MKLRRLNFNKDTKTLLNTIKRDTGTFIEEEKIVLDIINTVKTTGDKGLFSYCEKFDKFSANPSNILVTEDEIQKALSRVSPELLETIKASAENIRSYHSLLKRKGFLNTDKPGITLGQKITPLNRVGIYVPGGKASYPSTVLMDAIPAKVAGVNEIIMVTPPGADGIADVILAAASIAGVDKIYKCGGAQAIAALAYGTDTIPKVDKIVGPGNIYVAIAKRLVYGEVGIDSVAGPSEITVLADESASPRFIAADLLSQAEHDEMAQAILVTTSPEFCDDVEEEIINFLKTLPRREIMEKSLMNHGLFVVCENDNSAVLAVNTIAPEHLEIQTKDPMSYLDRIKNAGAIFLGEYTSEPLGDYFAGPDHVLPTNGTARFFSPLSTEDFIKRSSVISYDKRAFMEAADHVIRFANSEGLSAHANSIIVRKETK